MPGTRGISRALRGPGRSHGCGRCGWLAPAGCPLTPSPPAGPQSPPLRRVCPAGKHAAPTRPKPRRPSQAGLHLLCQTRPQCSRQPCGWVGQEPGPSIHTALPVAHYFFWKLLFFLSLVTSNIHWMRPYWQPPAPFPPSCPHRSPLDPMALPQPWCLGPWPPGQSPLCPPGDPAIQVSPTLHSRIPHRPASQHWASRRTHAVRIPGGPLVLGQAQLPSLCAPLMPVSTELSPARHMRECEGWPIVRMQKLRLAWRAERES